MTTSAVWAAGFCVLFQCFRQRSSPKALSSKREFRRQQEPGLKFLGHRPCGLLASGRVGGAAKGAVHRRMGDADMVLSSWQRHATLTSCAEVRGFTGLASCCSRSRLPGGLRRGFVEGYAEVAAPLNALGCPTARFAWTPQQQAAAAAGVASSS
jgi:hypothetical protein